MVLSFFKKHSEIRSFLRDNLYHKTRILNQRTKKYKAS